MTAVNFKWTRRLTWIRVVGKQGGWVHWVRFCLLVYYI